MTLQLLTLACAVVAAADSPLPARVPAVGTTFRRMPMCVVWAALVVCALLPNTLGVEAVLELLRAMVATAVGRPPSTTPLPPSGA